MTRYVLAAALVAGMLSSSLPALAQAKLPPIQERVRLESQTMAARYNPLCKRYGLGLPEAMKLATSLGSSGWAKEAKAAGVPTTKHKALWKDLTALPHPNFDQKTPYNLLAPGHDRWGVSTQEAIKGWSRYGKVIEQQALALGLDPAILGAYVWTESNFDAHQYNASGGMIAVGLGSVQAQDYPHFSVQQLYDPALNMKLTAREFKDKWNPQDMFGTVMDVWYPAWRSGRSIPHMGNAFGYVQLFSNRYFILLDLLGN